MAKRKKSTKEVDSPSVNPAPAPQKKTVRTKAPPKKVRIVEPTKKKTPAPASVARVPQTRKTASRTANDVIQLATNTDGLDTLAEAAAAAAAASATALQANSRTSKTGPGARGEDDELPEAETPINRTETPDPLSMDNPFDEITFGGSPVCLAVGWEIYLPEEKKAKKFKKAQPVSKPLRSSDAEPVATPPLDISQMNLAQILDACRFSLKDADPRMYKVLGASSKLKIQHQCWLARHEKYGKSKHALLKSEADWERLREAVLKRGPGKGLPDSSIEAGIIFMTGNQKKLDLSDQHLNAFLKGLSDASDDEISKSSKRKKADDASSSSSSGSSEAYEQVLNDNETEISRVVKKLQKKYKVVPKYSSEVPVYIDPVNASRYIRLTPKQFRAWAIDILKNVSGVAIDSPPLKRRDIFVWEVLNEGLATAGKGTTISAGFDPTPYGGPYGGPVYPAYPGYPPYPWPPAGVPSAPPTRVPSPSGAAGSGTGLHSPAGSFGSLDVSFDKFMELAEIRQSLEVDIQAWQILCDHGINTPDALLIEDVNRSFLINTLGLAFGPALKILAMKDKWPRYLAGRLGRSRTSL